MICQMMDFEKFFDSEILIDVLLEASRHKITNKAYRLLYMMNKKRKITVVTPVGESKEEEVDEGLGQGGLDSAILSASSVSKGLEDFFHDSVYESWYRELMLLPMSYQDDIMHMSSSSEDTRAGIAKFEALAETKLLTFNPSKSLLIVLGPKKQFFGNNS